MEDHMSYLRIPLAVDAQGAIARPGAAEHGRCYYCPSCHEDVLLRRGQVRVAHFAHKASAHCSLETILHQAAKIQIQQIVRSWKAGTGPSPAVERRCASCYTAIEVPIPASVEDAILELRVADGSVVDVALIAGGAPLAAVEVRVTHKVDAGKASSLPIPFLELEAQQVLDTPALWRPLQETFPTPVCHTCEARLGPFAEKASRVARKAGQTLPTNPYRYGIARCWKCGEEILVFSWPGHDAEGEPASPPLPRPSTVQFRYSRTAGVKYWANTCPYCRSLQGDFYLYDGPFLCGLSLTNVLESFKVDMLRIALHAESNGLLPHP
jgi:hypothetical protein